jgi:hypothetical protein
MVPAVDDLVQHLLEVEPRIYEINATNRTACVKLATLLLARVKRKGSRRLCATDSMMWPRSPSLLNGGCSLTILLKVGAHWV